MTKHIIVCLCPSTSACIAVSHFVPSNQWSWKTDEIFPFTSVQKSFQRTLTGNVCNNIRTWTSLKSQILTVAAFGEKRDSGDLLTNAVLDFHYLYTEQVSHRGLQSQRWFSYLNTPGITLSSKAVKTNHLLIFHSPCQVYNSSTSAVNSNIAQQHLCLAEF